MLGETVEARLKMLQELEPGWDGVEEPAVSATALSACRSLLEMLEKLPRPGIFPAYDGGVHLQWFDAPASLIEVDVLPSGTYELWDYCKPDEELETSDPNEVVATLKSKPTP